MRILSKKDVNMQHFGISTSCKTTLLHVKVDNLDDQAKEIVELIIDTSWIDNLGGVKKISYNARAKKTIDSLVKAILNSVGNSVTEEFGEILVSNVARISLEQGCNHDVVPLAEIWKEKVKGNPGFDFHSESEDCVLCFGEAKYSSTINPYPDALNQINDFLVKEKDLMELVDLESFVSKEAISNCADGKKGFIAAFSINSNNPNLIYNNLLKSNYLDEVIKYNEFYIIGVEV